jgi:hypothetical protein
MKTVVKIGEIANEGFTSYALCQLENDGAISKLMHAAKKMLKPCAFCGESDASIYYMYRPELDDPHVFYAVCVATMNSFGCGAQSGTWCAKDDDDYTDIKYAL